MSQTTLQLGDFVFQDMEIPESIPYGIEQRLAIKKLPGGVRVIDALGPDPAPLEWSGTFFALPGFTAKQRADQIQQMTTAGLPVDLIWDDLFYTVVIRSFVPDYRLAHIPYKIICEVLLDRTSDFSFLAEPAPGPDELITDDLNSANTLSSSIGDSTLSGLMATVSSAVGQVNTFVNATQSTINSVLLPVHAAATQVASMIATVDNTLASYGVPGGVLPSASTAANIATLTSCIDSANLQTSLTQLQGLLGRMSTNLGQINSSVRTVTVSGGNLYDIASKEYGDPTAWTIIANANGLRDPTLSGVNTLVIPPYNNTTAGVLTQ
ncbi:hypothetical protein HNQ50_000318 [Silvimonas terrae]|uniref:LysM domain-containing protein n=1 Tax=Silvimonas terrae TaxID=300266 RepID=A0A840RAP6_9NEIS|nr:hypothetical protein [Silvimonas terrae]MBB5189608.1 hypothetical protein [Silvimonas terrae]